MWQKLKKWEQRQNSKMIITKLETCHTKKIRVYMDEEFAFLVYPQDIRKYALKENMELSENLYHQIMEETIIRRAKQKAMALLQKSDRNLLSF